MKKESGTISIVKNKKRINKVVKKEIENKLVKKSKTINLNGGKDLVGTKNPNQYPSTFPLRFIDKIYNTQSLIFPTQKSCFTNGTFMFEDNDKSLFNALKESKFSHAWYKTTHKMVKDKPGFVCSSYHKDNMCKLGKIHQYEIQIPEKPVICGQDKIIKRVILMYNVKIRHDGVTKWYTFFKLESWPAISTNHSIHALQRYILKKEASKTISLKRREDCKKDKLGCKLYSHFWNKNYQDDHLNALLSRQSTLNQNEKQEIYDSFWWYDRFVRTGDELFVPQYVTNDLLKS